MERKSVTDIPPLIYSSSSTLYFYGTTFSSTNFSGSGTIGTGHTEYVLTSYQPTIYFSTRPQPIAYDTITSPSKIPGPISIQPTSFGQGQKDLIFF